MWTKGPYLVQMKDVTVCFTCNGKIIISNRVLNNTSRQTTFYNRLAYQVIRGQIK